MGREPVVVFRSSAAGYWVWAGAVHHDQYSSFLPCLNCLFLVNRRSFLLRSMSASRTSNCGADVDAATGNFYVLLMLPFSIVSASPSDSIITFHTKKWGRYVKRKCNLLFFFLQLSGQLGTARYHWPRSGVKDSAPLPVLATTPFKWLCAFGWSDGRRGGVPFLGGVGLLTFPELSLFLFPPPRQRYSLKNIK